MSFEPKELIAVLRTGLNEVPMPSVIKVVADAFEAEGIRILLAALRQGDPTPFVENRLQQGDAAGYILNILARKLGSLLTLQTKPRRRGPPPPASGGGVRGPRRG